MPSTPRIRHSLVWRLGLSLAALHGAALTGVTLLFIRFPQGRPIDTVPLLSAGAIFLTGLALIAGLLIRYVRGPLRRLIETTAQMAGADRGDFAAPHAGDEADRLDAAVRRMHQFLLEKQAELNRQRDEYQNLFESVPCLITVQDRQYRLIRFNREFAETFDPKPGDFCYAAYKGRSSKCENCPVEKTFQDGKPHTSEESGVAKDGTLTHWLVRTSPLRTETGEVVAAMEMSLDITRRKQLEEKLEISEQKYYAIFNNIPNPVFVLDRETLEILDCNESVRTVYGFAFRDIIKRSFLDLFPEPDRSTYREQLKRTALIHQARQISQSGKPLFVDIRISPSGYPDRKVLLVTTSDITKRLETEQQLIQASKMATLGEMATGIAHELNQPLSVMKTASSFILRKVRQQEKIQAETLSTLLQKIDGNVDRATKIIDHMRQFARKSDMDLEPVDINTILEKAFEIFSEQLKLREIEVSWKTGARLPKIMANPGRLEQVFINLLVNARDAVEERWAGKAEAGAKRIVLVTRPEKKYAVAEIHDTGLGIPEAIREKIFEPFFTTKPVGKGTGLGLSISYGIIKECGGTIRAGASPEGGACFTLRFPIPDSA